jgi:hypothetical protein
MDNYYSGDHTSQNITPTQYFNENPATTHSTDDINRIAYKHLIANVLLKRLGSPVDLVLSGLGYDEYVCEIVAIPSDYDIIHSTYIDPSTSSVKKLILPDAMKIQQLVDFLKYLHRNGTPIHHPCDILNITREHFVDWFSRVYLTGENKFDDFHGFTNKNASIDNFLAKQSQPHQSTVDLLERNIRNSDILPALVQQEDITCDNKTATTSLQNCGETSNANIDSGSSPIQQDISSTTQDDFVCDDRHQHVSKTTSDVIASVHTTTSRHPRPASDPSTENPES